MLVQHLIQQIANAQRAFLEAGNLDIKVIGLANSKQMLFDQGGINLNEWTNALEENGKPLNLEIF